MFTIEALAVGAVAAFLVGVSKTGVPGGGILAVPLLAGVFEGRQIAGGTLPILLAADVFAVAWYRGHARRDVLAALAPWIGVGYAAGVAFFVAVGNADRPIAVAIGAIVLAIVAIQSWRLWRPPPSPAQQVDVRPGPYGVLAGFTTFVANAAGPVLNAFLLGRRLDKTELLGTSSVLYFTINLSKIPLYVAISAVFGGGAFFSPSTLAFDAVVLPAVVVGVAAGRILFHRLPQGVFVVAVLAFSALGALNLLR